MNSRGNESFRWRGAAASNRPSTYRSDEQLERDFERRELFELANALSDRRLAGRECLTSHQRTDENRERLADEETIRRLQRYRASFGRPSPNPRPITIHDVLTIREPTQEPDPC